MTDEEFLFRQTERERKRNGRGDFSKKRQGGRHVRLPSDNMSAKERKAMNGECKTYQMNFPAKYEEFKTWPDEVKKLYLCNILAKYGVSQKQIADMMGCGQKSISRTMQNLKIKPLNKKGNRRTEEELAAWGRFLARKVEEQETKCAVEKPERKENEQEKIAETPTEEPTKRLDIDTNNLAVLLGLMRGSGAKVTIELTL